MFNMMQTKERSNGRSHSIAEAIRSFQKATASKASELESLLGKDYEQIKKAMEDLKPFAENLAEDMAKTAHDKIDQGWDATKEFSRKVDQQVHENSWKTLGAATVVALIIGYLMGRRD
jgi:ElaB/YqjD/DUF883 family membrane-anchored ribosome-binding protein